VTDAFQFDIFLSHSSKDKAVVRELPNMERRFIPLRLDDVYIIGF
jgi:hypothetical protein